MAIYEYLCKKCNTYQDIYSPMSDYKTPQYCKKCNALLKRIYSPFAIRGFPKGWSTFNNPDLMKPQTELQRKRQREFMENSIPISRSTT